MGREAQVAHFPRIFSLRVMKYFNSVWQWPLFIQIRKVVMKVPRIASYKIWEDETANIMRCSWALYVVAVVNGMEDRK